LPQLARCRYSVVRRRPAYVLRVPSELSYTVRRSSRARRVRVSVDPQAGVEVVLPQRAPARAAAAAVAELRPWIERRLVEVEAVRCHVAARGDTVPYLGAALHLVPEEGRVRVHRRGDALHVPAGTATRGPALERWYRRAAREEIAPRAERAAAAVGHRLGALTIRGQRTRWGSCSSTGALSFNWRLLLAPEAVLDYVVWHEACHLSVMDHSPRFWALVERHLPGYREPRLWLRRHGATLVL
jgi:predicted metal-dependent hydrolase